MSRGLPRTRHASCGSTNLMSSQSGAISIYFAFLDSSYFEQLWTAPSWPLQRSGGHRSAVLVEADSLSQCRPSSDRPREFPREGDCMQVSEADTDSTQSLFSSLTSSQVISCSPTSGRVLKLWLLQLSMLKQSGQAEGGHMLYSHALQEIAWNPELWIPVGIYTLNSKCTSKSSAYQFILYNLKPTFQITSQFTCVFRVGENGTGLALWQLPTLQRSQARGDFGHEERPRTKHGKTDG